MSPNKSRIKKEIMELKGYIKEIELLAKAEIYSDRPYPSIIYLIWSAINYLNTLEQNKKKGSSK